jgi:hypothetical protein
MAVVGEDQSQTGRREPRRLTVAEASEILGITVEAVRGRIKRGTLGHERTDKGVFVFLEADQTTDRTRPDTDQTADRLQSDASVLISAKDETIAALRDQLEAERQAHAEARRLLMAALERIPPQLEAPQEARESPQTAQKEPQRAEPRPATGGAQEGAQRRSWLRRMFGTLTK